MPAYGSKGTVKFSNSAKSFLVIVDESGVNVSSDSEALKVLKMRVDVSIDEDSYKVNYLEVKQELKRILIRTTSPRATGTGLASGRRKSASIIFVDREGREVIRFDAVNLILVKVKAMMDLATGQVVEEIEFVVEQDRTKIR